MSINNPDIDPANNYSMVGVINFAFQKMMQSMNNMLPATVTAYDRQTNRVSVQIAINLVTTDGQQVPRPNLVNVPVLILGGGTFSISFPLKVGDVGWVLANDRDISLFLQTYKQTSPNTNRMNNFADGMFIPDLMKSYNISSSNTDYLVIQSVDGTMSFSMGINSTTGAHEINMNADRININPNSTSGFVAINGNVAVSGVLTQGTPIPPYPP